MWELVRNQVTNIVHIKKTYFMTFQVLKSYVFFSKPTEHLINAQSLS